MRYVIAVCSALVAAVVLGVTSGTLDAIRTLPPEHKQIFVAHGISCAMNTAAFYTLVFAPLAVVGVYARARWRRRAQGRGRPVA